MVVVAVTAKTMTVVVPDGKVDIAVITNGSEQTAKRLAGYVVSIIGCSYFLC